MHLVLWDILIKTGVLVQLTTFSKINWACARPTELEKAALVQTVSVTVNLAARKLIYDRQERRYWESVSQLLYVHSKVFRQRTATQQNTVNLYVAGESS